MSFDFQPVSAFRAAAKFARAQNSSRNAISPLAYTTIMTVLERLVRKGKLARRRVGRAFVYSPEASRDAMRRVAIHELLESFFDGSEAELMLFLGGADRQAAPAPAEEHARIDTVLL